MAERGGAGGEGYPNPLKSLGGAIGGEGGKGMLKLLISLAEHGGAEHPFNKDRSAALKRGMRSEEET